MDKNRDIEKLTRFAHMFELNNNPKSEKEINLFIQGSFVGTDDYAKKINFKWRELK